MDLKEFLKTLKLQESTIGMILAGLVIIVTGFLAIRYFSSQNGEQILPPIQTTMEESTDSKYIVKRNDNLWTISEKYYGTGYNWVDIKEANDLENANEISEGQELIIPSVEPRIADSSAGSLIPEENESPIISDTPSKSESDIETKTQNSDAHKVEAGESLWKLAERYYNDGDKWVEIAKANNLENPSLIASGQELTIPNASVTSSTKTESQSGKDNYTVQKGDSLWSIASSAYGDGNQWVKLAEANKLAHPSVIHSGNTLTIPQ
jgi:nucleoid-associated protein YgaU